MHWVFVQKCFFPSTRFKGSRSLSRLSCLTGGKEKNYTAKMSHRSDSEIQDSLEDTIQSIKLFTSTAVQTGWIFLLAFSYTGTLFFFFKSPSSLICVKSPRKMAGCRIKPLLWQAPSLAVVMLRRSPAAFVSVEPGKVKQSAALLPRTMLQARSPSLAHNQGSAQTKSWLSSTKPRQNRPWPKRKGLL